jgi:hypothetical protein
MLCDSIALIVKLMTNGALEILHTCGILSRKGCDNYLKSQEKSVKNKKF